MRSTRLCIPQQVQVAGFSNDADNPKGGQQEGIVDTTRMFYSVRPRLFLGLQFSGTSSPALSGRPKREFWGFGGVFRTRR